jgi:membrane-associated phospholipid phosphatase
MVFAAMAIIVATSVILVKQHYLADVAGGFANATLCYWMAVKVERWKMKRGGVRLTA